MRTRVGPWWSPLAAERQARQTSYADGLMILFGEHVGVRSEVRYYHAFQVLDLLNLPNLQAFGIGGQKLDYGRVAAAVVFKF